MVLETMRVRHLPVVGTALLWTLASAVVGLVCGVLFMASSLFMGSFFADIPLVGDRLAAAWTAAGLTGLVLLPLGFAVVGLVAGLVATALANAALERTDGLAIGVDRDPAGPVEAGPR